MEVDENTWCAKVGKCVKTIQLLSRCDALYPPLSQAWLEHPFIVFHVFNALKKTHKVGISWAFEFERIA